MPSRDPAEWFHDLSVHIDDEELLEEAASLEPTLLHGPSRIGTAVWTILVSSAAGAFSGFTLSDEVRSSWLIFVLVFDCRRPGAARAQAVERVAPRPDSRMAGRLGCFLVDPPRHRCGVGWPDRNRLARLHGDHRWRFIHRADVRFVNTAFDLLVDHVC